MKRPGKTAAEAMAELERDPAHQARVREAEARRQQGVAANAAAAGPILQDLASVGFKVNTITELRSGGHRYPAAIPILLKWLSQTENRDVKQDIVRCLSVPYAKPTAIAPLIDEFRRAEDDAPGIRWTIANTLAVVADDSVVEEMIALANDRQYGKAREMLVIGLGNMCDPRVIPVLICLLDDDVVTPHAIRALGELKALSARNAIGPLINHPKALVRREAKRAIARIEKGHGRRGRRPA